MKNGNKTTSENILLKSFKELQKVCLKQPKELLKLALINSTPIFKLNQIKNKKIKKKKNKIIKEIPFFISTTQLRSSLAVKFILQTLKKKSQIFYLKFAKEILISSQNKGDSIQIKDNLQKQILKNKRYLNSYRWRF
jgi:ribosomal protein S7